MKWSFRTYVMGFAMVFHAMLSLAQASRTTSQILGAATSAPSLSQHEREVDYLKNTNHELPWVNEMEFRTETDEMDWERQEYLYRLSLNSTEEREAQRGLHRVNLRLSEIESQQILHDELMRRYSWLVDYHNLTNEIQLLENQKLVIDDRLKTLRVLASETESLYLLELISTEDKLHEIEQDIKEQEDELLILSLKMELTDGETISTEDIMDVDEIRDRIPGLLPSGSSDPEALKRSTEIEKSLAEYGFEESKNQRILDFVQIKYAGRDNLNFSRELSFGMGFNIPWKNSDRLDLNELALERIENENRLEAYLLRQAERWTETTQEIELLFEKHELASQQLSESQVSFSLEKYPQISDANPLVLLRLKESELKRQATIADIEQDIYFAYLKLLDLSGKMTESPLRNYLTADREVVE